MTENVTFIHGLVTDPFSPRESSARMPLTNFSKAKEALTRFVQGESLSSARELVEYFSRLIRIATSADAALDFLSSRNAPVVPNQENDVPAAHPFDSREIDRYFDKKYGISLSPKESSAVMEAVENELSHCRDAHEAAERDAPEDDLDFDENFPYRSRIFTLIQKELDRQTGADGYGFDGQANLLLYDLDGSPDAKFSVSIFQQFPDNDARGDDEFPSLDGYAPHSQGIYAFQHASSAFVDALDPEKDKDGLRFFICHADSSLSYEDEYRCVFHPAPHLSQDTKNVLVATDFASATVLSTASGRPVICAVNEKKLLAIADALAQRHPDRKIHVFANGRDKKAPEPRLPKNCRFHVPSFTIRQSVTQNYAEDRAATFADMAEMRGLKTVERALGALGREKKIKELDKGR